MSLCRQSSRSLASGMSQSSRRERTLSRRPSQSRTPSESTLGEPDVAADALIPKARDLQKEGVSHQAIAT